MTRPSDNDNNGCDQDDHEDVSFHFDVCDYDGCSDHDRDDRDDEVNDKVNYRDEDEEMMMPVKYWSNGWYPSA